MDAETIAYVFTGSSNDLQPSASSYVIQKVFSQGRKVKKADGVGFERLNWLVTFRRHLLTLTLTAIWWGWSDEHYWSFETQLILCPALYSNYVLLMAKRWNLLKAAPHNCEPNAFKLHMMISISLLARIRLVIENLLDEEPHRISQIQHPTQLAMQ